MFFIQNKVSSKVLKPFISKKKKKKNWHKKFRKALKPLQFLSTYTVILQLISLRKGKKGANEFSILTVFRKQNIVSEFFDKAGNRTRGHRPWSVPNLKYKIKAKVVWHLILVISLRGVHVSKPFIVMNFMNDLWELTRNTPSH